MTFEEWLAKIPKTLAEDSLWKMKAYRLALFAADLAWGDCAKLMHDKRTVGVADQLYRSVGAISADLAEGYSRGTGKDRARFYEYGLGSAREGRDWYFKGRSVLGEAEALSRMELLTEIIRLVLTMVPQQRGSSLREEIAPYGTDET